jgi:hypothetical protein
LCTLNSHVAGNKKIRLAGYVACTLKIRNYLKNLFAKPYGEREFGRPKRRLQKQEARVCIGLSWLEVGYNFCAYVNGIVCSI